MNQNQHLFRVFYSKTPCTGGIADKAEIIAASCDYTDVMRQFKRQQRVIMKVLASLLICLYLVACGHTTQKENKPFKNNMQSRIYKIILKTYLSEPEQDIDTKEIYTTEIPGKVNTDEVQKLDEPLRALSAFYSALGGTMCDGEHCDLTTELGLGKQGSEKHKSLIRKYFLNDKVAEVVLKQDCYLRPSGASSFSDYEFLTITVLEDTIKVDYKLMHYDHGNIKWSKGPDLYIFKKGKFEKIRRNLPTFENE